MSDGPNQRAGVTYNVDIIFCIDATGSMQPVLDTVKRSALGFYDDMVKVLNDKSKVVDQLRVKVIEFRDFYEDGSDAMRESAFFTLPAERADFDAFVHKLSASGGGDEPESGMEALACAALSEWNTGGNKRRHVVVLYTDASAHPLDAGKPKPATYPVGMPANFNEATDLWEGVMDDNAKRLLMFAPDATPWTEIANNWSQTIHFQSRAGEGLAEVDYKSVLDSIASSV